MASPLGESSESDVFGSDEAEETITLQGLAERVDLNRRGCKTQRDEHMALAARVDGEIINKLNAVIDGTQVDGEVKEDIKNIKELIASRTEKLKKKSSGSKRSKKKQ